MKKDQSNNHKLKLVSTKIKHLDTKIKHFGKAYGNLPLFSSLKTLVLSIITIVLFIYVISKLDFELFFLSLTQLNLNYFMMLLAITIGEMYLYSLRFVQFFHIKYNFHVFMTYLVGFVFGRVVPPRPFGEYLRLLVTMHYYKTNLKESLSALIVDNLYDGIFLMLFGVLATIILSSKFFFWKVFAILILIFAITYLFYLMYKNFVYLQKYFGFKIFYKLYDYFKNQLLLNLKSFMLMNKQTIFLGCILTIINYIFSFLKLYIILNVFGINLDFLTVGALWSLAMLIGNASMLPGGIGAFELTLMYLLSGYGVPESLGLTIAIIERFFNIWLSAIIGVSYFLYTKTLLSEMQKNFIIKFKHSSKEKLKEFEIHIKEKLNDIKTKMRDLNAKRKKKLSKKRRK